MTPAILVDTLPSTIFVILLQAG